MSNSKIKSQKELEKELISDKQYGKKIVACSGSFDLLHLGHIRFLTGARRFGDRLIVFLNSDYYIRSTRGKGRPIYNKTTRARMIAALEAVDYVLAFEGENCLHLLRKFKPHVFAQGQDWGLNCIERSVMKELGGVVRVVKTPRAQRTSDIIILIKKRYSGKQKF